MNIKYYKWKKKEKSDLFNSCKYFLELNECQFYQPYFSLYFHIHNTKKSHKMIDIDRRFFLKELVGVIKNNYDSSNTLLNGIMYMKVK